MKKAKGTIWYENDDVNRFDMYGTYDTFPKCEYLDVWRFFFSLYLRKHTPFKIYIYTPIQSALRAAYV